MMRTSGSCGSGLRRARDDPDADGYRSKQLDTFPTIYVHVYAVATIQCYEDTTAAHTGSKGAHAALE
jgi:hypothetical protein